MKRWLIILAVILFPFAAYALDAANERAAAAGDRIPGSLASQFARMNAAGDYLPGGDGGGGGGVVSTGENRQGNVWNLLRRYRSKWSN